MSDTILKSTISSYLEYISEIDEDQIYSEDILCSTHPDLKIEMQRRESVMLDLINQKNEEEYELNKMKYVSEEFINTCSDFSSNVSMPQKQHKNLFDGIKDIDVPEEVRDEANLMFNNYLNIGLIRKKKRICLKFHCLFTAYRKLGYAIVPFKLAKDMGYDKTLVTKSNSLFNEFETGFRPTIDDMTVIEYMPIFCDKIISTEKIINEVLPFTADFMKRNPIFRQDPTQIVAAGIFKSYCTVYGVTDVNTRLIEEKAGRTHATIDVMYKRVMNAL